MNNKGFTLVEILSIIVLLGLILIVVATNGFGAFNIAKDAISKENEKAIIEGAKVLLVEINNCDTINDSNLYNLLALNGTSCDEIINETNTVSEIEVTLDYLKNNKYIEGTGIDEIENPSDYKIKINFNGDVTLP